MLNIAIKIDFTISYYAGIMLNAFNDHYPQNYARIIGGSLLITTKSTKPATAHSLFFSKTIYTVLASGLLTRQKGEQLLPSCIISCSASMQT